MKFSLSWLKKFLDTDVSIELLSKKLVDLGIEIKRTVDLRMTLAPFITAEILSIRKHPEADKLNLCTVDYGHDQDEIVCGASNVRTGLKVVLAPLGAVMPTNNMVIERRKIRGVESVGMLCSAEELGLKSKYDGILELPEDTKVGQKFADLFCDPMIEVEVTPNRSDCFGIYGIARDLAAAKVGILQNVAKPQLNEGNNNTIKIEISASKEAPLFVTRYIESIANKKTVGEVCNLLESIEEDTISSVVDITNYINFSFGQPMHAYDASKIDGPLHVVILEAPEKFVALDGKEYQLEKGDLVIRDNKKICSLAGIIGGESTKCDENTKNILLEAAVFDPITIARTGRRLNLNTRSKHVFERGVDQNFTDIAIDIASKMILENCGGVLGKKTVVGPSNTPAKSITFNSETIYSLTGVKLDSKEIESILVNLGFSLVSSKGEHLELEIPSWRHDIVIKEDIVEEIIRVHGYDSIPELILPRDNLSQKIDHKNRLLTECRILLGSKGYSELVTWSFMSSDLAKKFSLYDENLLLANPISEDLNIMRKSIIPNLLSAVQKNLARSISDLAFFEIGPVYDTSLTDNQREVVSGILSGNAIKRSIYKNQRGFDFFDAKSAFADLTKIFGINLDGLNFSKDGIPNWYHPGKAAVVKLNETIIGALGEIHPMILKNMKIGVPTIGFELFFESLMSHHHNRESYNISDYQPVSRDFAFILDKQITAHSLIKTIKSINSALIQSIDIFDVYEGEKIEDDKKSIAINIIMHSAESTLNEQDINSISDSIISAVDKDLGGKLRQ